MRKIKKSNVIILIIILIYIGVLLFFKIFNNRIRPVLLRIANSECKKMATVIINDAVGKKLISSLTVDNLFSITTDNKGNITSVEYLIYRLGLWLYINCAKRIFFQQIF